MLSHFHDSPSKRGALPLYSPAKEAGVRKKQVSSNKRCFFMVELTLKNKHTNIFDKKKCSFSVMSMDKMLTFQEFETKEDAAAMAQKLEEHGITTRIEENRALLDQNILGKQYNNYVLLKIEGKDFERAQKILIDTTQVDISQIDKGYMLLSL